MSDARLRWGVIGAGWFASRRHLPEIVGSKDAVLAAICRRDHEALAKLAGQFQPETTWTDWREMLRSCPLDVVLIATPHHLHYEQARAALEAGLHVLIEKPMAIHVEDARELTAVARERGLQLGVALNPPYWAHCHRAREAVSSGSVGEIEAVDILWSGDAAYVFGEAPRPAGLPGIVPPTMYRADPQLCGGGFFIDAGSHLVSEVLWITGLRPVRVSCVTDATPSDRRAALTLTLENQALATLTLIGNSKSSARRIRKTYSGSAGDVEVTGNEFRTAVTTDGRTEVTSEKELPPVPSPVANMADAIRGKAPLLSPPEHGAQVVAVVEAAYRSAAEGRAVELLNPPSA